MNHNVLTPPILTYRRLAARTTTMTMMMLITTIMMMLRDDTTTTIWYVNPFVIRSSSYHHPRHFNGHSHDRTSIKTRTVLHDYYDDYDTITILDGDNTHQRHRDTMDEIAIATTIIDHEKMNKKVSRRRHRQKKTGERILSSSASSTSRRNDALDRYVHRGCTEVQFVAEASLPTKDGIYRMRSYRILSDDDDDTIGQEPCVIYYPHHDSESHHTLPLMPSSSKNHAVPVRVHDQCMTSEIFGSLRCDCSEQLSMSLAYIKQYGGVIIYLQQEGRGIGLSNKIRAYALQDTGHYDTVDANRALSLPDDNRNYSIIPSILDDLGISSISLMTNNPRKVQQLQHYGIDIVDTIPMVVPNVNTYNYRYMKTKQLRMNHQNYHIIEEDEDGSSSSSSQQQQEASLSSSSSEKEDMVHNIQITSPSSKMNNRKKKNIKKNS